MGQVDVGRYGGSYVRHTLCAAVPLAIALTWAFEGRAEVVTKFSDTVGYVPMFVASLTGPVSSGDAAKLVASAKEISEAQHRVMILNSEGGDLAAAMAIGRFARSAGLDVIVPADAVCFSACVFILSAGIEKTVLGEVGIHRPYFTSSVDGSVADAIMTVKSEAGQFFADMNISPSLAEDMFSIEPSDMRILTQAELRDYRLNTMDYVTREARSVAAAQRYGLSRAAYEAFAADLNYSCQVFMTDPAAGKRCMAGVAARHGVPLPPGMMGSD